MILPIISLIALALSIAAWALAVRQNRKLFQLIKAQGEIIDVYRASATDRKPYYFMRLIDGDKICVYRHTINGLYALRSCVKVFTDPDQEFNRREAEELIEKLNEK